MSTVDLRSLFSAGMRRKYPRGQILLYQGEKSDSMYYIQKGHVKVYDITAQGGEKLLLILGPGDMLPVIWTLNGVESLRYFYEAYTSTELIVLPNEALSGMVESNHAATKLLLRYFADQMKDLMLRLDCIESSSAKHKIGQVLDYLARTHAVCQENVCKLRISMTHQAIADMAGVTRETASLQLKDLENSGVIDPSGRKIIIYKKELRDFLVESN